MNWVIFACFLLNSFNGYVAFKEKEMGIAVFAAFNSGFIFNILLRHFLT